MKNKNVAGILALFFGVFGTHRFYLGQRGIGVLYIIAFFMGMMITVASDGEAPFIMAPAVLSFVDAILFFAMPKEDFNERYNFRKGQEYASYRPRYERPDYERQAYRRPPQKKAISPFKQSGIRNFRDYQYEEAIEDFKKALEYNYEDPATHFNLACCYSMVECAEDAFHHLEQAVSFGFSDVKKIHSHEALSYLRTQHDFDDFVENGYRQPLPNQVVSTNTVEEELSGDLLEQIMKLGDLREKGILTEEEFTAQKKKLLGK